MSKPLPRSTEQQITVVQPAIRSVTNPEVKLGSDVTTVVGRTNAVLRRSEGHPVNRKTGKRESGGPFFKTEAGVFIDPGYVNNIVGGPNFERLYSGPVFLSHVNTTGIGSNFSKTAPIDWNEGSMNKDGATAISQCAPTNPTSSLGTGLAETFREGFPSLPGIQLWKGKTEILRTAGSEYLNYQFGWAPLQNEVNDVVNAARHHRDIMKNYRHNEGRPVHRRFDFSPERQIWSEDISSGAPIRGILDTTFTVGISSVGRKSVVERLRKRWFEGCFTYGGPAKSDSFARGLGFGSDADQLYGLTLSPDVLWELTPWSWAVDWFTNAGDVINNVTQFALAGLVMRYGYMMEETTIRYYTQWDDVPFLHSRNKSLEAKDRYRLREGTGRVGEFVTTKARVPANPFGFGIGWEGLSPTQLAITAAIGITRLP